MDKTTSRLPMVVSRHERSKLAHFMRNAIDILMYCNIVQPNASESD